jgi:HK97 family phage portal protein
MDSPALADLIRTAGGYSSSGLSINPETAMRQAAVYGCVKVLAEDVGQLPLILYKRTFKNGRDGRDRATDHPYYDLMKLRPNWFMTSFNFREMLTAHNALRGNSYAEIIRVGTKIKALIPMHPDMVEVKCDNKWNITYAVRDAKGGQRTLDRSQVLHICGMTLNGYSGVSPITYARETIGLSMATEKYGAQMFKNGARMGGILSIPGKFKDPAMNRRVGEEFDNITNGDNAHKTLVLEEGMKWENVTMTSDDAQFLETRKFQIPEIARFFRMPLHKIQEMERATFSNIEQQSLDYVISTLGPWICRWEQALSTSLLTEKEQTEYYYEFNVDGLLRGDIKSRYEAHSRGILSGFLNRNEVRAMENRDAVEGLDEFLTPTNMALGTDPTPDTTQQDQAMQDQKQATAELKTEIRALATAFQNKPEPEPSNITVNNPPVDVSVHLPPDQPKVTNKKVTFTRDQLTGEIISAEVIEG